MSALGDRIRQSRKAAGISQVRMADALGVSPAYVCQVEVGGKPLSVDSLLEICNRFPDEELAEWLWLKLADDWGPEIATVMRKWAVATGAPR